METVTNLANAASKAIWGQQPSTTQGNETVGEEPVSGVQGKGDLNEPFDKGNETNPLSTSTHPTSNTTDPTPNITSLPERTADKMNPSTSNTFGSSNTHGSDPTGPHDSHLANKADPRIDSDHAGSYGNTSVGGLTGNSTGGLTSNTHSSHTGSGLTGTSTGGDTHSSHNDSERTGNSTLGSLTSGGLTGSSIGEGLTGNTHSNHTSSGLTGSSTGGGLTSNTDSSHTGSERTGNSTLGSLTSGGLTGNSIGEGLTGNTHSSHTSSGLTGSSTGGGLTSNTNSSHTDSERTGNSTLGSLTSGGLTGSSTGEGLAGNTHSSHTSGGLTGNSTGGGLTSNTHSSHTGSGLTGNTDTLGSDPSGPHNTDIANKLDPRVDSDQSGSFGTAGGLTGTTHPSHTSGGLTEATHFHTHGSDPTGPHESHLSNKADPRVDSDRIGSEGNVGTHSSHTTHHTTPSSIPTNPISGADRGIHPHQETDKTGVIGGHSDPFKTSKDTASESKSNTGAPSSGAGLTQHQGAANPTDEPTAEDFLKTKDPNDHSGEPMHMHTGAGDGSAVPKTQEERRESKVGNPGGQEHGRETEGTGEKWVKTSGMAADGGDFDATKPGAGREADRLMEQKGIHKSAPGKPSEPLAETSTHGSHGSHGSSHGTEGKEKIPLTQKIKEKLHIGSKHD